MTHPWSLTHCAIASEDLALFKHCSLVLQRQVQYSKALELGAPTQASAVHPSMVAYSGECDQSLPQPDSTMDVSEL